MKTSLQLGVTGRLSKTVDRGDSITLGGQQAATVFATPAMIHLMEHAAREALRPHLEAGEESVGVDVHVEHLSATPRAAKVFAEATVTMIEKNVIGFDVTARDPWGEIGRGTHRRAVIKTERFAERLAEKKTTSTAASPSADMPRLETLRLEQKGVRLNVILNRPDKRNAISTRMTSEWETLVDWLAGQSERIRLVVVSGRGDVFCGGDDVAELDPTQTEVCEQLSLRRGALYERITRLPQIFIAEIRGAALGGGLVLAAACDFRLSTHRCQFGLPEVRLGWPPNYGLKIVESLVGRGTLMRMALTTRTMSATEADHAGLVHQVVAENQLSSAVDAWCQQLLDLPSTALASAKQLLGISEERLSDRAATEAFLKCLQTPEARNSIARFSKRSG